MASAFEMLSRDFHLRVSTVFGLCPRLGREREAGPGATGPATASGSAWGIVAGPAQQARGAPTPHRGPLRGRRAILMSGRAVGYCGSLIPWANS